MRKVLVFIALVWLACAAWGQTEYVMDNLLVTDCFGELVDSGDGEEYGSNENFVFTVELEEDVPILVNFLGTVCIEDDFDFLTLWDGPADTGVLLSQITGSDFVPESVIASSGTLTIVFTSDNSLNLCGFSLEWIGQAPVPDPPLITNAPVACGATALNFSFSVPVGCTDVWLDSLAVLSGPAEDLDLTAASLQCSGDSATGFTLPLFNGLEGNCTWNFLLQVEMRDACDSLHRFDINFGVNADGCPISGTWLVDGAACIGSCVNVFWHPDGCLPHSTNWLATGLGSPLPPDTWPDGAAAGIALCFNDDVPLTLTLDVDQSLNDLSETFSFEIAAQAIDFTPQFSEPICSAAGDVELVITPSDGNWDGPTYQASDSWWLDVATAGLSAVSNGSNPPVLPLTYTTAEGCTLDTSVVMQYVEAGVNLSTCLGGDPIPMGGASNLPSTWFGYTSPAGLFTPDSIGVFELILSAAGCSDTVTVDVVPDEPPMQLGSICQTAGWQSFPEQDLIGSWTGPGMVNDGFDPSIMTAGPAIWLYQLVGCNRVAEAEILPIDIGLETFTSCPEQDAFFPAPNAAPSGGYWTGDGIASNGWFNPGNAPEGWGQNLIYTAPNGCPDTLTVHNIMTDVAAAFETCDGAPPLDLHEASISAVPWCGVWSGDWPGASPTPMSGGSGSSLGLSVNSWCDWSLHPDQIDPGIYTLTFTANTCSDDLVLQVFPSELDLDPVVVCSDADPLELAPEDWPIGGWWNGSGVNGTTGILTPAAASTGWQDVSWTAPGGCVDVVQVQVEAWQQAAFSGFEAIWCYQDQLWDPGLFPANGTTWTLDGAPEDELWISSLDSGLHTLTIAWNGAACASFDTLEFTMLPPLEVSLTVNDSTLCPGTATTASAAAWGGRLPEVLPTWAWSNGGFEIATTTYISDVSDFLVVTAFDGCSDAAQDSVFIEAVPAAAQSLEFGDTLCYGEPSSVLFTSFTPGYGLWWNGTSIAPDWVDGDTSHWVLNGMAGDQIPWQLSHLEHGCTVGDQAVPPSFSPVSAGFSVSPGTDCIAWDFLPLQLIDYSQYATSGWWRIYDAEQGGSAIWSTPYTGNSTPTWSPAQPGQYTAILTLENEGACTAMDTANFCVHAPVNWFLADQFSPNGDDLNDVLLVRSEPLESFEMTVYNRWGEQVWMSEDVEMGWNGMQRGKPAPSAVYAVRLNLHFEDGTRIKTTKNVTLVR